MTVFIREDLTPAQLTIGKIAEEFMRTRVVPHDARIHARDWALTRELLLAAGELDLLRIDIPEAYGGLGLDKVSSAYVGEKIGIMPSFAGSLGAHTTIGTLPLVYFGTPEQKERYLPRLASGEWIAAFALTEPGSGSDALAARARATLDGDHYVLNGQKMWITNGGFADLFTIFAKVDGERFTAFLVERGMGVVSGREEPKLGLDGSSTTALILENVRVPVGNVLGTIGEGHKVAFNVLNIGRLKLGTRNIGCAKQALARATDYAKQRHQFGRPIASFGMIRQKLAEMAVRCWVGDAMVYRTLGEADRALAAVAPDDSAAVLRTIESFAMECSINKVWTSEALAYVVDEAIQVYGGYGYSKEYPAERAYRDARITRLYEGTNEINRLIIPTRMLRQSGSSLAFSMLASLSARFGSELSEQQELLGHVADVAIETYAMESARLRTAKLGANALATDITNVYTSDANDRIWHSARCVLAALGGDAPWAAEVAALAARPAFDTVAARQRIAAAVVDR
ncbi:MAG TPA: acyl-CoA dehydrogenase family protein [Thermoanaerobaculia bacterium]|nr:acyl-CoA dehydrogenase family protein [Thermoanaerobaculia bacterium]